MFHRPADSESSQFLAGDKPALYAHLLKELAALTAGERDFLANSANCAALLFESLPNINWAGFYFQKGSDLVLGPQGKPACVRIGPGKGVCGAAAMRRETLVVPSVHEFPGHIACDAASNSEVVVPLVASGKLIGVLDIDSPLTGRFDREDAAGLERLAAALLNASDVAMPSL
jgi:GAF domain-containing protein